MEDQFIVDSDGHFKVMITLPQAWDDEEVAPSNGDRVGSFSIERSEEEEVPSGDADGDGKFDFDCKFASKLFVEEGRGVTVVAEPEAGFFFDSCLLPSEGLNAGDIITAVGGESTLSLVSVKGLETMCQVHADPNSGDVELTFHRNDRRRLCGPTWRDPPLKGCRYRVEGFAADRDGFVADKCDGMYEWEEHTHNKIIVPSFINKKSKVRISWNPHKKQWTARGTNNRKMFATLTAKPNAEWLDELESRRWQEHGFGRIDQVTITREDGPESVIDFNDLNSAPSNDNTARSGQGLLPPLSASGKSNVTGAGSGSGSGGDVKNSGGADHRSDNELIFTSGSPVSPQSRDDNEDEMSVLRAAFTLFDTDKSGYLDKAEFQYIMTLTSPQTGPGEVGVDPLDDTEFEKIYAEVDTDGSGNISVDEYLAWVKAGREYKKSGVTTKASVSTENRSLSAAVASALVSPADVSAGQADDGGDSEDDPDEEEPKRCCLLVCCAAFCMSFLRFLGRYLEVAEAGEWLVSGPLDLALGDYFAAFRYSGRLYWVYLQMKMLLLAISVVFLGPFPIVQAGIFLFCEIVHLVAVLWVMPFINFWNHCAAVISSTLSIILYIGFVGLGSAADPSNYSSLYVFIMMLILFQALVTQLWPLLVIIGQIFTCLVMAYDMSELAGGEEEVAPSVFQVTLHRAMARMTLTNIKPTQQQVRPVLS
jgi:hypothetical protein